mmetsp:Transcript_20478/g.24078  ORF Transcript_20478/g.24078 Transcript_20478/m.24078 type:complete len:196 (+) Transcript_20478:577-1164(+)
MGLACLGLTIVGSFYFPVGWCYTDEFSERSLFEKLAYVQVAWWLKRYFYYTAFSFTTGAFVAIGLGYNGSPSDDDEDDFRPVEEKWDRIMGVYIWEAETASNANSFLRAWNHRVHIWIKYYLSERLVGKDGRPQTIHYITIYFISAFWHGFYPFYYITFSLIAMATFAHKDIYQCWFLLRNLPPWLKHSLAIALT